MNISSNMPTLSLGTLELLTPQKEVMLEFYRDQLGLHLIAAGENSFDLGYGNQVFIRVIEDTTLPAFHQQSAGLYHLAILFESREALSNVLRRIFTKHPQLFEGSADHLVSEAFYFRDPDNNGVELYFDRDASTWQWNDGQIVMASEYIDPLGYIEKYKDPQHSLTRKLGHIHLQVGDIQKAREFYVQTLGLKITAELPTALFLSDGKYHHHIGLNTWHSSGATSRTPSLGLKNFTLVLSEKNDWDTTAKNLQKNNYSFTTREKTLFTADPWGNQVTLELAKEL